MIIWKVRDRMLSINIMDEEKNLKLRLYSRNDLPLICLVSSKDYNSIA